jgi:hypothetical protein
MMCCKNTIRPGSLKVVSVDIETRRSGNLEVCSAQELVNKWL